MIKKQNAVICLTSSLTGVSDEGGSQTCWSLLMFMWVSCIDVSCPSTTFYANVVNRSSWRTEVEVNTFFIYVPLTCIEWVNLSMSLHFHRVCIYPRNGTLWKWEKWVREPHSWNQLKVNKSQSLVNPRRSFSKTSWKPVSTVTTCGNCRHSRMFIVYVVQIR